ncbi:MAG: glycoside hydrolase family 31, partial [Oleiagrimonas sp.]|nr:glycoside hydrolase family 31 [Oleiagrimonas sp.]
MSAPQVQVLQKGHGIDVQMGQNRIELRLVRGNVLHVHYEPDGKSTPPSLVMSPHAPRNAAVQVQVRRHGHVMTLTSPSLDVSLDTRTLVLSVSDRIHHRWLLRQADLAELAQHKLDLDYASDAPMYGIHSFSAEKGPLYGTPDCATVEHDTTGLLRRGHQVAKACPEGGAGAPFVWSTRGFGLLVDTKTASFDVGHHSVSVEGTSRPDLSYYIISGRPDAIFSSLADLSGHPQLFPKWATGFTNS